MTMHNDNALESYSLSCSLWAACRCCGLLQPLPPPSTGYNRICWRCRTPFGSGIVALQPAFALVFTMLVLLAICQFYPVMSMQTSGRSNAEYLVSGVTRLENLAFPELALLVFFVTIVAPLVRISAMIWVLAHIWRKKISTQTIQLFRIAEFLRLWAMLDVMLLGAIVSSNKLRELAQVDIGIGFWALGCFVLALVSFESAFDRRAIWDALKAPPQFIDAVPNSQSWVNCHICNYLQEKEHSHCERCNARVFRRKHASLSNCWALVIAGFILYIPANAYPVLTTVSLGQKTTATIMGSVRQLAAANDWSLATVLFTASIIIPLLKLLGLTWLMISVHLRFRGHLILRTRLYRFICFIGRWSNTDIFVGSLLTGLVPMGSFANVMPENGAIAFGAVVLLTMFAAEFFDPRLMWDAAEENSDGGV